MKVNRTALLAAIAKALDCPRNHMGKLEPEPENYKALEPYKKLMPHGGHDIVDQVTMICQSVSGLTVRSISDRRQR